MIRSHLPFAALRFAVVLAFAAGCSEVAPTNPFDPSTPVTRQAPASVVGHVVLHERGASAEGVAVRLLDREGKPVLDLDGKPRSATLTPEAGNGEAMGLGAFQLGGIQPGSYRLAIDVDSRFASPVIPEFTLGPGEVHSLGTLVFERQDVGTGRIHGEVALKDALGGARTVSLYRRLGSGNELVRQVRTDADGKFDLDLLPPGTYALSAELTGFTPAYALGVTLAEAAGGLSGNDVALEGDQKLVLHPVTAVLVPSLARQFGQFYTNADRLPLLVLAFGGMTEMRLSTDPAFLDADGHEAEFVPYNATAEVGLPATEGPIEIYGQFRMTGDGFAFTSDVYRTTVIRDVTPPSIVALGARGVLPDAGGITWLREEGATLSLEIQGNDASSAVAAYGVYHDAANSPGSPDVVAFHLVDAPAGFVRLDQQVTLMPGQGPKVVAVYLKDRAGNVSPPVNLEVIVDSVPPALAAGESIVAVNANQQKQLDTRLAQLRIRVPDECRGPNPTAPEGECALDFRAGQQPMPAVGLFSPFVLAADDTVTVPVSGANGQSAGFEVQLRDRAGNVATYASELYVLKLVGTLSGRVLVDGYADDAPAHGGIVVDLFDPGPDRTQPVATGTTAADGTFTLKTANPDPNLASTRIPAGHYIVVTSRADLQPFEAETDVRENENAVLPAYRVTPARGNITGRFVRADRLSSPSAHGGIEVSALRGGVLVAKTQTSDDGTFVFPAPGVPVTVEQDRYTLVAAASGYASRKVEGVEVLASQTTIVDPDGATPPAPKPQELSKLSGDFAFCESLSGECIPTLYTNGSTVRVKLLDATGVTEIRVQGRTAFEADANDPPWQPFTSTGVYTATIAGPNDPEGAIDVFVQTKVAGTVGPVMNASIIYDHTPPAITSFQLLPGTNALDGFTNETAVRAKVAADAGTGKVAPLQGAQVVFSSTALTSVPSNATACLFDVNCSVALPRVAGVIPEQTHTAYAFACDQAKNCSTVPSTARIVYDATAPKSQNGVTFQPQATWITNAAGTWYTRTSRVDVQLGIGSANTAAGTPVTDLAGKPVGDVVRYRFGLQQDLSDAGWNAVPTSVQPAGSFSASGPALTGDDGKYRVYAQFMDAAGNATDVDNNPRNFDITLDRLPPAVAFTLNGGSPWTTSPTVTLDVTNAAGDPGPAREVWLTLDGGLFNTYDRRVLPLVGTASTFTLPSADGAYVVYARFIDAAGNVSDRPASIFLDRTKPSILSLGCGTCRVDPATGTVYSNATSRQAVIDLVAVDNSGQIASIQTKIDNAPAQSGAYVGNFTATFPDQDGPHTVTVTATDPAGNVSATQTVTIVLDRTPPNAGVFVNADAPWATNPAVVVSVDNHDGAAIAGMRLSNTATFSGPVQPYAASVPWTLASPTVDGLRTVYVELTDPAGNQTTASDSILLDSHAPTAPVLTLTAPASAGPGNAIANATITLAINATDAAGSLSTGAVQLSGDVAASGGSTGWLSAGAQGLSFANGVFSWTGDLAPGDGPKSVTVKVRDAAGNVSDGTIIRFQLQTVAPGSTTASLAPAPYTTTTAASLTLTAVGASQVKVSGDVAAVNGLPSAVGSWVAYASTLPVTLTTGDGLKAVTVTFRNDAGLTSTPITLKTTLDGTAPTGTLAIAGTIADGATSTILTGTAQVLLKTTSTDATSGVSLMRFGNTLAELSSASWRAAADTVPWTLPGADGTKTVYLQLADAAGNTSSPTAPISATIALDTQPPTTPVVTVTSPATMGPGNAIASATGLVLGIAATDAAGALTTGRVRLDGDVVVSGGAATTGWSGVGTNGIALASGGFTWSGDLVSGDGAKALTVTIRDAAGNVSGPATVRFNVESQAPANPSVAVSSAPFTASTAVTLSLAAVGASQVRIAGDLASVNGLPSNVGAYIAYATSVPVVLTPTDGAKNIDVTFRNDAGIATSTIRVTTTLDLTVPSGTFTIVGTSADAVPSSTLTSTTQVQLSISATDATSGLTQMRVASSSGALATATWQPFVNALPWTLASGDGAKTVYLQLRDAAGNTSSAATPLSASINLDGTAPSTPVLAVTSPASLGTGNALSTTSVTLSISSNDGPNSLATGAVLVQGDVTSGGTWLKNGAGVTFGAGAFTWSGALTSGDGAKTVLVTVRDAAGNLSAAGTIRFNLQTSAPTNPTASVSPAPYAATSAATVAVSANGASQVRISGDLLSVSGSPGNVGTWITYAQSIPVVLTSGDGAKNLSVTFRNDAGLPTQPIALVTKVDTAAPTGSFTITGPVDQGGTSTSRTGARAVTLAVSSTDTGSGVTQMRVADSPANLATASYGALQATVAWTLPAGDGTKTVYVQLMDAVGNESSALTASTTLDLTAPTAPRFTSQPGTTNASTITLDLATTSSDALSGPVRYELLAPSDTAWSTVTFPQKVTLAADKTSTYQVRAVDLAGNVSATDAFTITQDSVAPPAPNIVTPRIYVNATTTSVSLAGSDQDPSFLRYETCTQNVAIAAACPTSCSFAPASASFALSLAGGQRTCVLARAVDKGGNTSAVTSTSVVSDLTLPVAPGIAPQFSPAVLSVRATEIELFASSAATDLPLGGPAVPWVGVAYLEVNTGAGYQALCPGYLNVQNAWDPCNPAKRCTDARLRCADGHVDGFMLPLVEGAVNTLSVRAVDLAGNIGDGTSVTVNTDAPRQVTTQTGNESDAMLFGGQVGYTSNQGTSTYAMILNLGANRIYEPLYPIYDSTCYVDSSFSQSSYARLGSQGTTFSAYDSSAGATKAMFKPSGADGTMCTGDDGASVTLATVPAGSYLNNLGTAGKYAAWSIGGWSGCSSPQVRQGGANGILGDGDDTLVNLSAFQIRGRNGWLGSGPEPLQITPRNLLLLGNCPNYNGTFTVVQPSAAGYGSYSTFPVPSAYNAVLSQDGSTLAYVATADGQLYVRQAGADGMFGTSDDVAASRAMLLDSGFAYYQLAAEATRVVAIDQDSSGRQETNLRIHSWSAGADGRFDTSATADDTFREGYLGTLNRLTPSLSAGLLVYGMNQNLYSIDYSTSRWEAVRTAKTIYPTDSGAGVMFYADVGAGYSGSQTLRARTADGNETTIPPGTIGLDTLNRAWVADGQNLLLAQFDLYNTTNWSLTGWSAGPDGTWFTGDDVTRTLASAATWGAYVPLAAGGGKAVLYNGAASQLQVVDPGVKGGLWSGAAAKVVGIASMGSTSYAGVSANYVTWVSGGSVWVKSAGADGLFGTADDGAAVTLNKYPASPGTAYGSYWGDVQMSGKRIAFHEDSSTPTLTVVDAGSDGLFNTSDDTVLRPTLRVPSSCSAPSCNYTLNGDFVGFTDVDANGNTQAYVLDLRSNARLQVSYTSSVKSTATIGPGGRLLWTDSLFSIPSVFSWAP